MPQTNSQNHLKTPEEETAVEDSPDQLPYPYEFLKLSHPPLHTFLIPHFSPKSITFGLSLLFVVGFAILLGYSYSRPLQNDLTWNCSVFALQNKYYPRLRYRVEVWRVPISFLFHSNIAHFILNLIGFQIYGYFVEWYIGHAKYAITLAFTLFMSHFLSCIALPTTVSTTSSSALFAVFALKVSFLFEYRNFEPLRKRRIFIYLLLALIFAINLIPIFVNNNVDYTAHIAGFVTGGLMAVFIGVQR
jgi:membrane associated rhomboid family serine protease